MEFRLIITIILADPVHRLSSTIPTIRKESGHRGSRRCGIWTGHNCPRKIPTHDGPLFRRIFNHLLLQKCLHEWTKFTSVIWFFVTKHSPHPWCGSFWLPPTRNWSHFSHWNSLSDQFRVQWGFAISSSIFAEYHQHYFTHWPQKRSRKLE